MDTMWARWMMMEIHKGGDLNQFFLLRTIRNVPVGLFRIIVLIRDFNYPLLSTRTHV